MKNKKGVSVQCFLVNENNERAFVGDFINFKLSKPVLNLPLDNKDYKITYIDKEHLDLKSRDYASTLMLSIDMIKDFELISRSKENCR